LFWQDTSGNYYRAYLNGNYVLLEYVTSSGSATTLANVNTGGGVSGCQLLANGTSSSGVITVSVCGTQFINYTETNSGRVRTGGIGLYGWNTNLQYVHFDRY